MLMERHAGARRPAGDRRSDFAKERSGAEAAPLAWRRRPRQPVADRLAKAIVGNRRHGDAGNVVAVDAAQHVEQVGRRLAQVARRAEVEDAYRLAGAADRRAAEGEQRLARLDAVHVEPHAARAA